MKHTIPTILQAEAQECGAACLAMVASALGRATGLRELRVLGVSSDRGMTVRQLVHHGATLGVRLRPVRLPLEGLSELTAPAILHWDLHHYVVLESVRRGQLHIIDPAQGSRRMSLAEVSRHFTGVALQAERSETFVPKTPQSPSLSRAWLWHQLRGQLPALGPILGVALLLELLLLLSPWIQQLIVDEVVMAGHPHLLLAILAAGAVLLTTGAALQALRSFWVRRLGLRLSEHCQDRLFAHALRLSPQYFARRGLGDTLSRFDALEVLHRVLVQGAPLVLIDLVLALLALALMLVYAPLLAWTVVGTTTIVLVLRWWVDRALQDATQRRVAAASRQHTHLLESLRSMAMLKLQGGEGDRRLQWGSLLADTLHNDGQIESLRANAAVVQHWISGMEHLLILGLAAGALLTSDPTAATPFTLGMLLAFLAYRQQFSFRIHALADMLREWRLARVHLDRLSDIVEEPAEIPAVAGAPGGSIAAAAPSGAVAQTSTSPAALELRDLGMRSTPDGPWLFRHLNLQIAPGSSVALAGPSGCGKSTLLDLITGLRRPTEGCIVVDGRVVQPHDWAWVRAQLGVVRQDDTLLSGSVLEAIAPFDPEPDAERVVACAQRAQVHHDILSLPGGYAAPVGECGASLSGGQRQRLMLARALYRRPRLLLLDEATSHLDVVTERAVAQAIAQSGTTRLFVAHRPETLASAERRLELVPGQPGMGMVLREVPVG